MQQYCEPFVISFRLSLRHGMALIQKRGSKSGEFSRVFGKEFYKIDPPEANTEPNILLIDCVAIRFSKLFTFS
jgi:hypothetical protein